jgi:hypothetical protein
LWSFKLPHRLLCNLGLGLPPERRSLDGDLQRLFVINDLLHYHFLRQNLLIDGDSAPFTDDHVLAFGHFSLFWSNQYLGVLQINGVDQKKDSYPPASP